VSETSSTAPPLKVRRERRDELAQKVLVVDVGGTHLKILATGSQAPWRVASGTKDDSPADVQLGEEVSKRLSVGGQKVYPWTRKSALN
jgi:hypothetical protein